MATTKTYVITASIHVDWCESPDDATRKVEELNDGELGLTGQMDVYIRLPDSANELNSQDAHWELSGTNDDGEET
jgi:hypothetical protein